MVSCSASAGTETIRVDVRIVGSTNANLPELATAGTFRKDLLDRLAFDVITIPPLRERTEDIMPLAYAFAVNMVSELKLEVFAGFSARATSSLLRYEWPGNVRELKNAVERSVYRADNKNQKISRIAFDPFDSPFKLRKKGAATRTARPTETRRSAPLLPTDLKEEMRAMEKHLLQAALDKSRFNQRVAANLLGLSYDQLRGKIRKHELDRH